MSPENLQLTIIIGVGVIAGTVPISIDGLSGVERVLVH